MKANLGSNQWLSFRISTVPISGHSHSNLNCRASLSHITIIEIQKRRNLALRSVYLVSLSRLAVAFRFSPGITCSSRGLLSPDPETIISGSGGVRRRQQRLRRTFELALISEINWQDNNAEAEREGLLLITSLDGRSEKLTIRVTEQVEDLVCGLPLVTHLNRGLVYRR